MPPGHPISPGRIDGSQSFQQVFGWSAELVAKLEIYEASLRRWQKAVNLVAPRTLDEIWHRHFADSAQVALHLPPGPRRIADLGSGGGFPGLVLALFLSSHGESTVTLIESDGRKAAFLRETARLMEISVEILSTRIESDATVARLVGVDTVSARAFAPLGRIFSLASPLFTAETVGVFLKGENVQREIDEARVHWCFDAELHRSMTDPSGQIAVVRHVRPKTEA